MCFICIKCKIVYISIPQKPIGDFPHSSFNTILQKGKAARAPEAGSSGLSTLQGQERTPRGHLNKGPGSQQIPAPPLAQAGEEQHFIFTTTAQILKLSPKSALHGQLKLLHFLNTQDFIYLFIQTKPSLYPFQQEPYLQWRAPSQCGLPKRPIWIKSRFKLRKYIYSGLQLTLRKIYNKFKS